MKKSVYKQFKTESTCTVDTCDRIFSKHVSDIYPELPKIKWEQINAYSELCKALNML